MSRTVLQLALVLLLIFLGIKVLKSGEENPVALEQEAQQTSEERARTRRFWEIYRQATDLRIAGRTEMARVALLEALLLDPDHEDALYYLGAMERTEGDFEAAAATWERLLEINPAAARAHAQLGDLHLCYVAEDVFNPEVAALNYQRAHDLNKEETGPLLGMGRAGLVRRDFPAARRAFMDVLGSNEGSVASHFFLGYLDWKEGRFSSAREHFTAAYQRTRPDTTAVKGSGEGDTRAGTKPMTSDEAGCALFRPHLDRLYQPEQPALEVIYRALDRALPEP